MDACKKETSNRPKDIIFVLPFDSRYSTYISYDENLSETTITNN